MRVFALAAVPLFAWLALGQHDKAGPALPKDESPLRKALLLLRQGQTQNARQEINRLLQANPSDAELYYQLARTYLTEFYSGSDPLKKRTSLALAMEALANALKRSPDHIPVLKAKAIIHARAELQYYDPNLAYELAERVAKLQPSATEYLLNLSDWMSGEIRFIGDNVDRVPHDPQLGLDRSIKLLDRVIDSAMPYSNEEAFGFLGMARTLAKRGNLRESIEYYQLALSRPAAQPYKGEILRDLGTSYYRMGNFAEAARTFYRAMQEKPNAIDGWLLKVAVDQWGEAGIKLPNEMAFPMRETSVAPDVLAGLEFKDAARELGLNRFGGNGTVAWGDYDGDGRPDVAVANSGMFITLYRNEGARFREATAEAGLARMPSGYSVNFVDYDNDGALDMYLSLNGWSGPLENILLRNTGDGKFENVTKKSGAGDAGSGFVSLWGDLDNDGDLDFAVANGVLKDGSTPQVYRNNGDGTFTNMTKQAGIDEPPQWGTIGIALGDYDKDGDLDLFINGLQGDPNRLYRNMGGFRFTEVSKQAGVTQPGHYGYVAFFTDYNNDGWPDILATSLAPWEAVVQSLTKFFSVPNAAAVHADSVRLFRNNRNGTFTDVTWNAKLYYPMGVMGAGVADLDNDGFVDFYFGTGDPQLSRLEPNRFFRNNGDGTFTELTWQMPFARPGHKGHGVAFIDLDEDGDLEVFTQLGGHFQGDHTESAFYRNLKGNRNHWLQIDLVGTKSNRFAVGAQVTVRAGSLIVYREVKGSEGFGATNQYRQHFGLGKNARVDSVEVVWPSGIKQSFAGVEAGRIVEIVEGREGLRRVK